MKKTFLTVLLVCSAVAALGQGTVHFSNGVLARIQMRDSIYPITHDVPTTPGLINYGLFYGIGQSTSLTFLTGTIGVNSTSTAGIIASPVDSTSSMSLVPLPGTTPNESDVWLQVKGWDASFGTDWQAARDSYFGAYFGQTDVRNIPPLGSTFGPGTSIWQSASGTNAQLFNPFTLYVIIPEPSIVELAGLGAAALMIFRRRR